MRIYRYQNSWFATQLGLEEHQIGGCSWRGSRGLDGIYEDDFC